MDGFDGALPFSVRTVEADGLRVKFELDLATAARF
jgi:hypothetical protein